VFASFQYCLYEFLPFLSLSSLLACRQGSYMTVDFICALNLQQTYNQYYLKGHVLRHCALACTQGHTNGTANEMFP
jgi:hypothetical protein